MTVNAVRLNHAVLFVADLERSIAFYQQAFDMSVAARETRANAAFLRLPRSGNHHDLGLFGVGEQPPRPRGSLGLYHLASRSASVRRASSSSSMVSTCHARWFAPSTPLARPSR